MKLTFGDIRSSVFDKGNQFLISIVSEMERILRLMESWDDPGAPVALEGARRVELLHYGETNIISFFIKLSRPPKCVNFNVVYLHQYLR